MASNDTDGDVVQPVIYNSDCVDLAIVTVPADMTLAAASTVVGLLGTGPVTEVTSENGSSDSLEPDLCLLIKLFIWSPQFKWPPMSPNGPFLIARNIQQEFMEIYSVTAAVSRLLTCVVRWNEAVHWPFFKSYTGKTILLSWDPRLSLQVASIHHQLSCSIILIWLCPPPNLSILMLSELHWQYSSCRQPLSESFPWYIAWLLVGSSCVVSDICAENACRSLPPTRPSTTGDTGALLLTLGWPDVLPCGVLIVQPLCTMVQLVTFCLNELSLEIFAIPSVDYMMMNIYTPCCAWMLLNDSFLQAGISSYFKGNPCPCGFELLSWKFAWTLVLESLTVSNGSSGNYPVDLTFTCTSYACVIFLQPKPPWSYLAATISKSLHIIGISLEFNQFGLSASHGSRTHGCLDYERKMLGQQFIWLLGLLYSCDQIVTASTTYFDSQYFEWQIPWYNCDKEFLEAFLLTSHPHSKALHFPWDRGDCFAFAGSQDNLGSVDAGSYCPRIDIRYINTYTCWEVTRTSDSALAIKHIPGWILYLPVTCILQCGPKLMTWEFARSEDDSLTCTKQVFLSWNPGGSTPVLAVTTDSNGNSARLQFLYLAWDPGGCTLHRLEGKPNFKEGGLSATSLLGWPMGRHSWAMACSGATRGGNIGAYIPGGQLQRGGLGTERNGTERKGGFGRGSARRVLRVSCLLFPFLPP